MGVALVRIPFFRDNGIYNEDFVFAVGEEELKQFLGSVRERERQQNMKKVTVYTDARNGSERHVESITRSVGRDDVVLSPQIKQDIFRSLDQFFEADRSFYREYDIPYKRGFCCMVTRATGKQPWSNPLRAASRVQPHTGKLPSIPTVSLFGKYSRQPNAWLLWC